MPSRSDWGLLPGAVESWGMSQDITGKSKGKGKAWVGAGPDREAERAAADAAAAARSPELAAELAAENEHGRRLMAIGARMAGKAERALRATVEGRSGRMFVASEASIADATADATAALVFALRRHADGRGVDWSPIGAGDLAARVGGSSVLSPLRAAIRCRMAAIKQSSQQR